ncbi:transposase domain-containing protein [Labrys okinawensis]|uniref:transposase domain-containing protein n=1 Tax=Labrys okinawensis TaxID=346911 RepID=UPI0039BD333A
MSNPDLFFARARTIGRSAERSGLSRSLYVEWIAQALALTGKASVRRRKLPAEEVVWLVIALALRLNHQESQCF